MKKKPREFIEKLPLESSKRTTGEMTLDSIFKNQLEMHLKINEIIDYLGKYHHKKCKHKK